MSKWTTEELKSIQDRYNQFLRFATNPVGLKFFESLQEAEGVTDVKGRPVKKASGSMALCQFIAQSRYMNNLHIATVKEVGECQPGKLAVGFQELPEEYPKGYVNLYFNSEEMSRKMFASMPVLPLGKYEAVLATPLERMPVDPDVVLFYGNTAQIYKMVMAYGWDNGERLTFTASGEAWCSDAICPPMLEGKPHIAFCCNGGRILSWPSDNEVSMGIPGEELEHILKGLEFRHRNGVRYPITWFHITWPVGPPVSDLLQSAKK